MEQKIIVVSVGGSLIVPDGIAIEWLASFKLFIESYLKKGYRFIIICGGGKIARRYQEAAKTVGGLDSEDVDWIGIHCTRLNAHLLRTIFKDSAHPAIVKDPTEKVLWKEKILIAAGWKPGWSTDYDAVLLAEQFKVKKLLNLTNIDYVYDKDPRVDKDAKPIQEISWKAFRKIIPKEWSPGINSPFDPVAAREAERLGMEVVILNGNKLENMKDYLDAKAFVGTRIAPI